VGVLAANPTIRTQSVQAEVYTLHLLLLIAILLAGDSYLQAVATNVAPRRFTILALLVGLALTHHATTILLLPPLAVWFFLANRRWWRPLRIWAWGIPAALLPLLLYLYIPLRSGPDASPWYHQILGMETLTLYAGGPQAFWDFVSGRSISVGYYSLGEALGGIPTAAVLWLRHFEWPGLLLAALGLFVLVRLRNWPLLALTTSWFVLQQLFNLFYAIGDIFVYYIPLYLLACIWLAFGANGIGAAFRWTPAEEEGSTSTQTMQTLGTIVLVLLFWLPLSLWTRYTPLIEQLHSESVAARGMWETILAAKPPPAEPSAESAEAILVSNDRNEIVPLFYLQAVEGRALGTTGLFPLIAPDARFADIGATVQTSLDAGGGAPVYLVKPMDGLEVRFALQPAAPPLVEVTGPAATAPPATATDLPYGPLRLLGYDLDPAAEGPDVTLHWEVVEPLGDNYTTTVQLFDAAGEKLGQDDRRPGGDYYPTSLWKEGEVLLDRHTVALPPDAAPLRMLVGMYDAAGKLLAAPLEIDLGD
jgi:hypothetical protein